MLGEEGKVCNELVSTGDIDRDGNTGAASLGTRNRCHSALGETLRLEGTINGSLGVHWGRSRGCISHKRGPSLFHSNAALDGLWGRFMGVRGGGRRGMRQRTSCGRVGVKNELLDGNNLFAVAEFLQLTKEGLDLFDEGFTLCIFQLTKDFLCSRLALHR